MILDEIDWPAPVEDEMPKAFDKARAAGAKIRTVELPGNKYMHVAIRPGGAKGPKGGRTVSGEVKTKKTAK